MNYQANVSASVKNGRFLALVALFVFNSFVGFAQVSQTEPFAFKSDKLEMSLKDFKVVHHDNKSLDCKEKRLPSGKGIIKGMITCYYLTTVVNEDAKVFATFAREKLATILVMGLGYAPRVVPSLQQALKQKFGEPQSSRHFTASQTENACDANVLDWDNSISMIELQSGSADDSTWSNDVATALAHRYCVRGQNFDGTKPLMWYIHKSLAVEGQALCIEAEKEEKKKAGSDI